MINLSVFQFESNNVRVLIIKGEPWFVARDVLAAIGSKTKVTDIKALVDEDLGEEFATNVPLQTAGGVQNMLCLSEPALTLFVSRSRTELGKSLNRWIHTAVLPALRKTGTYSLPSTPPTTKPGCLLTYEERVLQLPQNLNVPYGYWAVLKESAYLLLHVEQVLNCPVDRADLLDGSIGKMWASWRKDKEWAKPIKTCSYKYPVFLTFSPKNNYPAYVRTNNTL